MTKEEIEKLNGEALAAAVATEVMGWHTDDPNYQPHSPGIKPSEWWVNEMGTVGYPVWEWRPDRDIAQAFEVVSHVLMSTNWQDFSYQWLDFILHRATFRAHRWGESGWPPGNAVDRDNNYYASGEADSAPTAFCRCALLAVQETK
jgi:hypothetical protein